MCKHTSKMKENMHLYCPTLDIRNVESEHYYQAGHPKSGKLTLQSNFIFGHPESGKLKLHSNLRWKSG